MSNLGNKLSRLSAGTRARQGHRTEQAVITKTEVLSLRKEVYSGARAKAKAKKTK